MFVLIADHHVVWLFINGNVSGLRFPGSLDIFFKVASIVLSLGFHFWGLFLPFMSGASAYFYMKKERFTSKILLKRVFALIGLGYLMNYFAWGANDLFSWDVLPFIALCSLVTYPVIRRADRFWHLTPLLILGSICLFSSNLFPFKDWQDLYFYKVIIGDIEGYNYWPFVPWFSLFVAGTCVGYLFYKRHGRILTGMTFAGLILLLVSGWMNGISLVVDLDRIWGVSVFKPSSFHVIAVIGFGLTVVGIAETIFRKYPLVKQMAQKSFFVPFGRSILWVYIFSTIFGYKATLTIAYFCENIYEALFLLPIVILINWMVSYYLAMTLCRKKQVEY